MSSESLSIKLIKKVRSNGSAHVLAVPVFPTGPGLCSAEDDNPVVFCGGMGDYDHMYLALRLVPRSEFVLPMRRGPV